MTATDPATVIPTLREGDVVEVDHYGVTVRGTVITDGRAVWLGDRYTTLRTAAGEIPLRITAVRVISRVIPPLPPEPPVGSGWFHDGVLFFRCPDDSDGWHSGDIYTWQRWSDIQPGVPAVPQPANVRVVGDWTTEPTSVPGSVAVLSGPAGCVSVGRWGDTWEAHSLYYWIDRCGPPVAVIEYGTGIMYVGAK